MGKKNGNEVKRQKQERTNERPNEKQKEKLMWIGKCTCDSTLLAWMRFLNENKYFYFKELNYLNMPERPSGTATLAMSYSRVWGAEAWSVKEQSFHFWRIPISRNMNDVYSSHWKSQGETKFRNAIECVEFVIQMVSNHFTVYITPHTTPNKWSVTL